MALETVHVLSSRMCGMRVLIAIRVKAVRVENSSCLVTNYPCLNITKVTRFWSQTAPSKKIRVESPFTMNR